MLRYSKLLTLCIGLLGAHPAQAQFSLVQSGVPQDIDPSEHVDLADVDLDGDWDAAFANGGDVGARQNVLWINMGGAQGGSLGTFEDQTASRFPVISDVSREIEFVDIDGDGDSDIYIANDSTILNQTSRWWINNGGIQGQSTGFFSDFTSQRWVGLGGTGSSVSASLVFPLGGFIDWGSDGEFADLDNDGDLDLIHASYGGSMSGQAPTRLFLNDGLGFFSEFNPSGYQLIGGSIPDGEPALWAEGQHVDDSSNATGQSADIADAVSDADVLDMDGDFDLDIVWSGLNQGLRTFENRGVDAQGLLPFRDVTQTALGTPDLFFSSVYDVEVGDLDGDDHIDLYVINGAPFELGSFALNDMTFLGDGAGGFSVGQLPVPNTGADDNEADFIDYDNDGVMDVFISSFSGDERLFRGIGGGLLEEVPMDLGYSSISWDSDLADLDLDGDLDAVISAEPNQVNFVLENVVNNPDAIAPRVTALELLGDAVSSSGERVVRTKVLDNSPYYRTAEAQVDLVTSVDGFDLGSTSMRWSGGEVFRGTLPANLVGEVAYQVQAFDLYGNLGVSSSASDTVSGNTATSFGAGSSGVEGPLPAQVLSTPFAGERLFIGSGPLPLGSLVFLAAADQGSVAPIDLGGDLVLNLTLPWFYLEGGPVDAQGNRVWSAELPSDAAGASIALQTVGVRADTGGFQSSAGLLVTVETP